MRPFRIVTYIIILIIFSSMNPQTENDNQFEKLNALRLKVLEQNIIGKEFQYDLVKNDRCNKTKIKYLGSVTTNRNKQYKILTSFFVHGNSCRGITRIVIYNISNQYIGNYKLGMPDDLPDTLINNDLVFLKGTKDCNSRKGKSIQLHNGLPKTILIPCSESKTTLTADKYSFSNEE